MGVDSTGYNILLLLHILSAIIGFGGVILNGLYAAKARQRPPAEALAVMEVNTFVSLKVAEVFIYLTALWGFGLVGMSDKAITFGDTWVYLAIIVYGVALGLSHGLLQPKVKRMVELQREVVAGPPPQGPPPQATEMAALGKQIAPVSMVLDLALVVILVLMIWKPGA
jgi:hypothetical protein